LHAFWSRLWLDPKREIIVLKDFVKTTVQKAVRSLGLVLTSPGELHKEWESAMVSPFLNLYEVELVLDIGANAGQYATMLRKGAGYKGRIVSCEPTPQLVDRLRHASALDHQWIIEHCAVSRAPGLASFNIMNDSEMSSLAVPTFNETNVVADFAAVVGKVDVTCTTVDALIEKYGQGARAGSIYVKTDTQGWEENVVAGMRNFFDLISCVQMELSFKRLYENSWVYEQAISHMSSLGFELAVLLPNNAGLFPFLVEMDGIFRNTRLPVEAELRADRVRALTIRGLSDRGRPARRRRIADAFHN
jgi:FkbM family methyltransferase